MNKILKYIVLSISVMVLGSCEDFFDINTDPNNPTTTTPDLLLTNAELGIVNSLGIGTSGFSSYLGVYMHQITRRQSFDAYITTGNDFAITQAWTTLYSIAFEDLREVIRISTEQEAWHYVGIAEILKAYTYSNMVDVWGNIPFSEANTSPATYTPKLDTDSEIYPQLFAMLDAGIEKLEMASSLSPGTDDLIYGGDLDKWRKAAKTIKLKLYSQLRLVQDISGEVNALLAEGDLISDMSEDFEMAYVNSQSPENRNPGYIADYSTTNRNFYISIWFYEILTGKNSNILTGVTDPRVPYYFYNQLAGGAPAENPEEYRDGDFVSIYFGSSGPNQAGQQDNSQTITGLYPTGGRYDDGLGGAATPTSGQADIPQRLLPYFTRLYIEAELAHTGVIAGDARALLQQAMQASFEKVNELVANYSVQGQAPPPEIAQEDMDAYMASVLAEYDAGDANKKLEVIMTQKWIASFGFSVDQYNDYRRTGFPVLYDPNTDNLSYTNASLSFPTTLPYSTTEVELNPNVQQKNPREVKVFWDAN